MAFYEELFYNNLIRLAVSPQATFPKLGEGIYPLRRLRPPKAFPRGKVAERMRGRKRDNFRK